MRALRLAGAWDKLLDTVRWIEQRQALGMYLRQIDVPGVDTKFIERYRATVLGHRDHWVIEPSPTAAPLDCLDRAESALYADLISNAYAPSVRLEQERVSFTAVEKAVAGC
jgi:hypothetical protein